MTTKGERKIILLVPVGHQGVYLECIEFSTVKAAQQYQKNVGFKRAQLLHNGVLYEADAQGFAQTQERVHKMSYQGYIYCTECGAQAPLLHEHGFLTSYACSGCEAVLTYDGNEGIYHLGSDCWECDLNTLEDNDA